MCDLIRVYLLILALIIYSGLITYLYFREKNKQDEEKDLDNDIDVKIQEIGERLHEIKKGKKRGTSIDFEDEDW